MKLYPRFLSRIGMALRFLLSGLLPILLLPASVRAAPPLPSGFYGAITSNGAPVAAGTAVSAWINGVRYAQTTTFLFDSDAVYVLDVPGDDTDTQDVVEGGKSGDLILFKVGEQTVAQSATWQSGTNIVFNLQLPPTLPTITVTGPTAAPVGTSATLAIVGQHTHFVAGTTTVDLGAGIAIDSVQVASATALTVSLTLAPNALTGARAITVTTGAEVVTQPNAFTVLSGAVAVAIPTTITGTPGSQVTIPILVSDDITGREIISFQFTLTYDTAVLHYTGLAKENTLSSAWDVAGNESTAGVLHVAGYGQSALSGKGTLVNLHFTVAEGGAVESPLALTTLIFNEGEPSAATSNGQFTRIPLALTANISGNVHYWQGNTAVPTTTITAAGPSSAQTTTGADGHYQLSVPQGASYLVSAAKTGDQRAAISALDAAEIAQCVVQKPGAICGPVVSDVSGDGTVTAYDAARIAHFLVGLDGEQTGQWQFDPATHTHANLAQAIADDHFTAFLLGDVNGNWSSTPGASTAAVQSDIRLTISPVNAVPGTEITVPVSIGDIGGQPIRAYEFTLAYDKAALQFQRVVLTDTLSQGWPVVYNDQTSGVLPIVGYSSEVLDEDGILLKLVFTVNANLTTATAIHLTKNRIMDQAVPPGNIENGTVAPVNTSPRIFLPMVTR